MADDASNGEKPKKERTILGVGPRERTVLGVGQPPSKAKLELGVDPSRPDVSKKAPSSGSKMAAPEADQEPPSEPEPRRKRPARREISEPIDIPTSNTGTKLVIFLLLAIGGGVAYMQRAKIAAMISPPPPAPVATQAPAPTPSPSAVPPAVSVPPPEPSVSAMPSASATALGTALDAGNTKDAGAKDAGSGKDAAAPRASASVSPKPAASKPPPAKPHPAVKPHTSEENPY